MRTIGLIGGMSWESTLEYYRLLNREVQARCGGLHSARMLLYSVDFAEMAALMDRKAWDDIGHRLAAIAARLEEGGADFLVLATNTMHKVAEALQSAVGIPLLHIADVVAEAIRAQGLATVGLLGTRPTMEEEFYRGRLQRHGIEVLTPDAPRREEVHRIIFEELCRGEIRETSRVVYLETIRQLARDGAQGVVFGCTEIGLLVEAAAAPVPVFDSTPLHARAAVDQALSAAGG